MVAIIFFDVGWFDGGFRIVLFCFIDFFVFLIFINHFLKIGNKLIFILFGHLLLDIDGLELPLAVNYRFGQDNNWFSLYFYLFNCFLFIRFLSFDYLFGWLLFFYDIF